MMRLTDYVTSKNVKDWWESVEKDCPQRIADEMFTRVTPEMKALAFTIHDLFGVGVSEVGVILQYLDAAIECRTKVQMSAQKKSRWNTLCGWCRNAILTYRFT